MSERRHARHRVHDDGFAAALRKARLVCAGFALFPVAFGIVSAVYLSLAVASRPQPVLAALLTLPALAVPLAAPAVREQIAGAAIAQRRAGRRAYRRTAAVYGVFGAASVAAYLVAELAALFGFVATVLVRSFVPLAATAVSSYAMCAYTWPRRSLWMRWARDAGLRDAEGTIVPGPSS